MTVELCASIAAGKAYFGLEYGRECWYSFLSLEDSQAQSTYETTGTVIPWSPTPSLLPRKPTAQSHARGTRPSYAVQGSG
jgi:hypothetical protein